MLPRIYVDSPLAHAAHGAAPVALPSGAARHVQVLRLQPGTPLILFDGQGGEWSAVVVRMGRSDVDVLIGEHHAIDRELPIAVTLAVGMPANERMDTLVEKATELGVAAIVPLVCERSVLRLSGERAERKVEHWQGVARAACEQSGRTRVPTIAPIAPLSAWLKSLSAPETGAGISAGDGASASAEAEAEAEAGARWPGSPRPLRSASRWLLSLRGAEPMARRLADHASMLRAGGASLIVLSGPEGGFGDAEEALARARGFDPVDLGPRVLRSDTAPLAVLAHLSLWLQQPD